MTAAFETSASAPYGDANIALETTGIAKNVAEFARRVGDNRVAITSIAKLFTRTPLSEKEPPLLLISRPNTEATYETTPTSYQHAQTLMDTVLHQALELLEQDGIFVMEIPSLTITDGKIKSLLKELMAKYEKQGHFIWISQIESEKMASSVLLIRK